MSLQKEDSRGPMRLLLPCDPQLSDGPQDETAEGVNKGSNKGSDLVFNKGSDLVF